MTKEQTKAERMQEQIKARLAAQPVPGVKPAPGAKPTTEGEAAKK
jgi:hypothetical protein